MSSEMMHPDEWLAEAQACDVGRKQKVQHLCGDASLVVYNNVDSWSAWCWRCHTRGWVPKPDANMKERLARQAQQKEIDDAINYSTVAPHPAVTDLSAWSPAARLWLYRAGLPASHIKALGAYYHAASGRVVLPIKDSDGALAFWQARNPEYPKAGGAKYISSSVPRDRVHVRFPRTGNPYALPAIVLCEDILSAYKCGAAGACGYAVMGTTLGNHTLAWLAEYTAANPAIRVCIWCDPDAAGRNASSEFGRQLRLLGISAVPIRTGRDPKLYSLQEIGDLIRGSYTASNNEGSQAVLSAAPDVESEVG